MSVRAYDPALGRFLSRDPLGRVPLFFGDQPYVYGGNNPLINVDPSGQFMATEGISNAQAHVIMKQKARTYRVQTKPGRPASQHKRVCEGKKPTCQQVDNAKHDAEQASKDLFSDAGGVWAVIGSILTAEGLAGRFIFKLPDWVTKLFTVLIGAALDVSANLAILSAVFRIQSGMSDSYWMAPLNLVNFEGSASFDAALINLYTAASLAALTIISLEANPVLAAALAAAGVASIGMMVYIPYRVYQYVSKEQSDLGF